MAQLPPSGNPSQTRPENRVFYPALDGLRAVAFFLVFGQHYLGLAWGWAGVDIFFVLSGFLITGILFDTRDDPHRVRSFYVRRTLRIFPLYYGLFAVLLLLWPVLHWRWDRWWLLWPLYLGNFIRFASPASQVLRSPLEMAADGHLASRLLPNTEIYLGHLWSLCVEEQFYLLWPWVVFWVRDRRRLLGICAAAVVLGPLLRFWMQATAPTWLLRAELLYRFTPAQVDALLLGGLLALLWRGATRAHMVTVARVAAPLGTLAIVLYLGLVVRDWRMATHPYPRWTYTSGLVFVDLYAAALMICALEPATLLYWGLRWRPLRWVGRLSYGAYVFHDLLHGLYVHLVVHLGGSRFAEETLERDLYTALLAMPCTLVLAWLSFRFLESPFLRRKDLWTRRV